MLGWQTDQSVTAIAMACGFTDGTYLGRLFKKAYGVTPKQYRAGA